MNFSYYQDSTLGYIGEYIVRKIMKDISCNVCADALVQSPNNLLIPHSLVTIKDNGGLFFLSMDVWKIIRLCEIAFRVYVSGCDFRKPTVSSKKNIKQIVINRVMSELLGEMIFISLYNHDLEHDSIMENMHSS